MSSAQPSLLPHATRELAEFAATTRFEQIPPEVIERIKLSLIDGLGVCLQGSTLPWTRIVHDIVGEEGGKPVASVWGRGRRTSLTNAVLANSTAGHAFEMDDIHKESIVHPNSLAVPVAMALAEADPTISGRDIALALSVGYEVGLRIGNAATMSLFLNGFHPQGTSGAFVAAATAGKLLGLDAEQMQNALGIAGSMAAGLMAAQEGAMVKRLHAGRAAQGGLTGGVAGQARIYRHLRCRRGRLWRLPELVCANAQSGKVAGRSGERLGSRQGRLQDVSQRHQHPCRPRCIPVDPDRGKADLPPRSAKSTSDAVT